MKVWLIQDSKYGAMGVFKDKETAEKSLELGGWERSAYNGWVEEFDVIEEPVEGQK